MERTSVQLTVSLPPELYRKAMQVAKKELRTKSELVREALREFIARRALAEDARLELAKKLKQKGIGSLEDLEKLIDEGR